LSRLRRNHIRRTQPEEEPAQNNEETYDLSAEDQELAARIEARRRLTRRSNTRKKRRTVILMILAFAVAITMCSREIVRLKAQNYELKKQHAQLEAERDRLTQELGHVGDKEYIKEQARKQLKLLDPGEKLFIFDDGKDD
jgi:cell division protein FtsB